MAKTTVRKPSTKASSKAKIKPRPGKTSSNSRSKPAPSKSKVKKPPPRQQKPKAIPVPVKKRLIYTEQQLGIPKLNMITPIGVQKSRGKKKGKIFVDDRESMMTILAMVNADKEGQFESKMMKARQLEEIREARRNQQDARQEAKKSKLEETKALVRRKRKRNEDPSDSQPTPDHRPLKQSKKKKVSFA